MSDSSRRHPRFRMVTEARVTRGARVVAEGTLDVSEDGVAVRAIAESALSPGDAVEVALRIPGSTAWVEAEGEVARAIEGRRAKDDGRAYGIRFRRMSGIARRVLTSAACWHDQASGARSDRERDPRE